MARPCFTTQLPLQELLLPKALLPTSASRVSKKIYFIPIDNDLTNKWLHRLRMTSGSLEGRDKLGQIQSVLDFFNKPSTNQGQLPPINWKEWESNIHTAGVVGKIKAKYDAFMKAEYNVESAVGQVGH